MPTITLLSKETKEIAEWIKPVVEIVGMEPSEVYNLDRVGDSGYTVTVLVFPVEDPYDWLDKKFGVKSIGEQEDWVKKTLKELENEWLDEGAMDLKLVWGHSSLLVILSGLV